MLHTGPRIYDMAHRHKVKKELKNTVILLGGSQDKQIYVMRSQGQLRTTGHPSAAKSTL